MKEVFSISHACFTPIGIESNSFFDSIVKGKSALLPESFQDRTYFFSKFSKDQLRLLNGKYNPQIYCLFEQLCLEVAVNALSQLNIDPESSECLFLFSSTKGNIAGLNQQTDKAINLRHAAQKVNSYFHNPNSPIVISNACISGSLALNTAKRLLENGRYKHILVIGCDCVSDFIAAGFQSFQALSTSACRPFDKERNGLNLGEAAACIILSVDEKLKTPSSALLSGGGITNDANHLSGPSRSGAELAAAISKAMMEAEVTAKEIDFISAHGTATIYNDEMEAKAFAIAEVNHAPLHSLKSYVGHTLGAAGILESMIAIYSLNENVLIPSLNFKESGVSTSIHVIQNLASKEINTVLKTASGFGGCNAALIWQKQKAI